MHRAEVWGIVRIMMRFKKIPALVAALFLLQIISVAPASAALRDRSWEFGTFVTGAFLDNESNVENNAGVGIRAGYFFLKNHALEVSIDDVLTEPEDDSNLNVNLLTLKVGYLFTFMPLARVTPHLTIGAGVQDLTVYRDFCDNDYDYYYHDCTDTVIDEDDPVVYVGIGMRAFFGKSFHLRADFQANAVFPDDGDEDVLVDQVFNAGVGWIFGSGR